jgi:hypothetical protein
MFEVHQQMRIFGPQPPLKSRILIWMLSCESDDDLRISRYLLIAFSFMAPLSFVLMLSSAYETYRVYNCYEAAPCELRIKGGEKVERSPSNEQGHPRPEFFYMYQVNGRGYYGTKYGDMWSPTFVELVALQEKPICWYDPADPSRSVLVQSTLDLKFVAGLFLGTFLFSAMLLPVTREMRRRELARLGAV